MKQEDIPIVVCYECFAVHDLRLAHYCPHCGAPTEYRRALDRKNEKRRKSKSE